MKSVLFSNLSLLVVIVPVLSMQTVSTWLIDSTELDLCRSTPESAILAAAIMYVSVMSRKSAMGTTSRQRTKTSRIWPKATWVMKRDLKMVRTNRIPAMSMRILVIVPVSIWRGVSLEVNFLALLSIWEA